MADLNIDAILPGSGNESIEGLNGGRFISFRSNSNYAKNNNDESIGNNNLLINTEHSSRQNQSYGSQKFLSKTNIIHTNNPSRNRVTDMQQNIPSVAYQNTNKSVNLNNKQHSQDIQQRDQKEQTTKPHNWLIGLNNTKNMYHNNINTNNSNSSNYNVNLNTSNNTIDVWLNAWDSTPSTICNTSTTDNTFQLTGTNNISGCRTYIAPPSSTTNSCNNF